MKFRRLWGLTFGPHLWPHHDTHQNWIGQNWFWPKLAGPKPRWPKMDWPKLDWPKWSNQDGQNEIGQSRSLPSELGVETSAEIDGQLFVVLSALTDGESFDVVMSAGGDHGFERWRKLHGRWNPHTARGARSLLREIWQPSRVKLLELMGAVERMEDLVRRYCSRRDAQGNAHNLAEDIRLSSLEALLPDDLEKHVQLNRARLTSCGVSREKSKHTVSVEVTQHETRDRKERHTQEETTQWTLMHLAKARQTRQGQRQREARTARTTKTRQE